VKFSVFRSAKTKVVVGVVLALLPLTAFADFLSMSGDGVVTITTEPLKETYAIDFGTVCQGSGVLSKTFQLQVTARSHTDPTANAIIFANGSTATVSVSSISGSGLGASVASPGTIAIPANWTSLPDGSLSPSVNSTVTLDTSTSGAVSGAIVYGATGTNLNNSTFTKSSTLDVTANIVNCAADVSVKKTAASSSINAGDAASFTLTVSSLGPASATNVVLSDVLPGGVTWTVSGADATAAGCAGTLAGGSTLSCSFGTLAAGATRSVTLSATTTSSNCGTMNNTATVSASNDSNSSNNSSSASITIACQSTAQFAPTQTTCQQFVAGTALTQGAISYNNKNGVINNAAPGVVFYYTRVAAPSAGSFSVAVSQSDTGTTPPFGVAQILVYTANCGTYQNFTTSTNASGTTTINIDGAAAGQSFIVSVKVDPKTVVGSPVPNPSTVTYTYTTSVNGVAMPSSIQSILLQQQQP